MKPEVRYQRFVRCSNENPCHFGQLVMRLMLAWFVLGVVHAKSDELIWTPLDLAAGREPEPEPDAAELERLYQDYLGRDFADAVPELARQFKPVPLEMLSRNHFPAEWTENPWKGGLRFMLGAAWSYHMDYVKRGESRVEDFETLLEIVEDRSIGLGRLMALQQVSQRLNFCAGINSTMPVFGEMMGRLGKIASDPTEELDLRSRLVPVLFQHDDPNLWLDTAMKLSSGETNAVMEGQNFRNMAPSLYTGKLTAANRAKYLNHAFGLLEAMDDGHSGHGSGLAGEIAQVVAIQQGREVSGIFRPAVDRPEFHKDGNLTEAFFQSYVDDARWWWQRHRIDYVTDAATGDRTANNVRPRKSRQSEDPGHAGKKGLRFMLEENGRAIWMLVLVVGAAIIVRRVWRNFRMALR